MPVSRLSARGVPVDEATEPVALPGVDGAPQRQDDITAESAEPAADEESRRSFSQRIGSRKVLLALAWVAALFVGFGSMTVLLRLVDWPSQSDPKPVPTTATPVAPPSAAAPAVTTPPASAATGPTVENEPPLAAPESVPPPRSRCRRRTRTQRDARLPDRTGSALRRGRAGHRPLVQVEERSAALRRPRAESLPT